ncbi:MAG: hypothetical protein HQK52_11405 [Oligoflexia bacterium]|nr:hypothetical protein [Oligoflexia bacterium]
MTRYLFSFIALATFVCSFSLYAADPSTDKVKDLANSLVKQSDELQDSLARDLIIVGRDEGVSSEESNLNTTLRDRSIRDFFRDMRRDGRHFYRDNFRDRYRDHRDFRRDRYNRDRYYRDRYDRDRYYPRNNSCSFLSNPRCYCYYHPYNLACRVYFGFRPYSNIEETNDNALPTIIEAANLFAMDAQQFAQSTDQNEQKQKFQQLQDNFVNIENIAGEMDKTVADVVQDKGNPAEQGIKPITNQTKQQITSVGDTLRLIGQEL